MSKLFGNLENICMFVLKYHTILTYTYNLYIVNYYLFSNLPEYKTKQIYGIYVLSFIYSLYFLLLPII